MHYLQEFPQIEDTYGLAEILYDISGKQILEHIFTQKPFFTPRTFYDKISIRELEISS